jgi:MFS family permease
VLKWAVLITLGAGQFIMVLDSTVMNVSIQRVIGDLHTTVSKVQLAIATYTMTTAALLLIGGKVGDIIGRRRAFRIGLVAFGIGAGVTALAQSMGILIGGWSILEAVGAALMIPAILALIAANYEGPDRVVGYGVIGGISGAAAAAGPIVGGWVATIGSWRDVFAGEAVIVVVLLLLTRVIRDAPLGRDRPHLDVVGGLLSASGLALAVLGVVESSTWGWIDPKDDLTVAGVAVTPFGLSAVPFLIVAGCGLIVAFVLWERRVVARRKDPLVQLSMMRLPQMRAGLSTMAVMMLCLGGMFFVLPLYLQIVLGKNPLQTGVAVLPLSLAVFFVAGGAARLSTRVAPRLLIQTGLILVAAGSVLLLTVIAPTFGDLRFTGSVLVIGIGLGLVASQVTNVNLASAGPAETSEVGALQGTARNLGSALGTAIVGSLLLGTLTTTFDHRVERNSALPAIVRSQVAGRTKRGLVFVPAPVAAAAIRGRGVPEPVVRRLKAAYSSSQVDAIKIAVGGVAVFALLGCGVTRRLPARPVDAPPVAVASA